MSIVYLRRAAAAAALAVPLTALAGTPAGAAVHTVRVVTTIQDAVNRAAPGDTVLVPAGTYRESVLVTTPGLTITSAQGAVLDGGSSKAVGIQVQPKAPSNRMTGFTLRGLRIQNFADVGVLVSDVDGVRLTGGDYRGNAEYGLFPIRSSGRIDHNTVSGSDDSGIYVGQADDVLVDHNLAQGNTIGVEVELSTHVQVEDNLIAGNSVGALVQIVPDLPATLTRDVTLTGNTIVGNNRPNPVTDPEELLSLLPSGIGVLSVGADDVRIKGNTVTANRSLGIGIISLPAEIAATDPRLEPAPDRNAVAANLVTGNGRAPDPSRPNPLVGVDVAWDGTGTGNCFTVPRTARTFPLSLPACPA
jgi:parallel beta-helix repeat protein